MKINSHEERTKYSDEMKTSQLVNSLADELKNDARKAGGPGILPIPGFTQKCYGIKLSEALRKVCEPILNNANDDIATIRSVFATGAMAWNLTILASKLGEAKLHEVLTSLNSEAVKIGYEGWNNELANLMERKRKLFPQIDIAIIDCKIVDEGNEYRFAVAGIPYSSANPSELKKMFPGVFDNFTEPPLWRKIAGKIRGSLGLDSYSGGKADAKAGLLLPKRAAADIFHYTAGKIDPSQTQKINLGGTELKLKFAVCPQANCDCGDISLELAIPGRPGVLSIDLNIFSRKVATNADNAHQDGTLVSLFNDNLNEQSWTKLRGAYEELKRRQGTEAGHDGRTYNFDFSGIENYGEMTLYSEVFQSEAAMILDFNEKKLSVDDFYCLNPACNCHDATVEITDTENDKDGYRLYGVFTINYRTRVWNSVPDNAPSADDIPLPVLRLLAEHQIADFYQRLEEHHKKLRQLYSLRRLQRPHGKTGKKKKRKK